MGTNLFHTLIKESNAGVFIGHKRSLRDKADECLSLDHLLEKFQIGLVSAPQKPCTEIIKQM